ncbi:hypothetical protein KSS87_014689 [Heliosperma pusillum]|nr:hypothetical protein KSS87_014689 [Heliosperma pusillum]
MDDFLLHPPGWDDPNMYKEESAEICQECFPIIQKTFPEVIFVFVATAMILKVPILLEVMFTIPMILAHFVVPVKSWL